MTVVATTVAGNTDNGIWSGNGGVASLGATIVAGNTRANCVQEGTPAQQPPQAPGSPSNIIAPGNWHRADHTTPPHLT